VVAAAGGGRRAQHQQHQFAHGLIVASFAREINVCERGRSFGERPVRR
jgi:hypothetical protein